MNTFKRLTLTVLDVAMIMLAINALAIVLTMVLRPLSALLMMHAFIWLLPVTALVMLFALALDRRD